MSPGAGASNRYSFGSIQTVPPLSTFLDIVLSRTQRKTPTVIHKGYSIGRIRDFYLRKVRYTQETFDEKLGAILDEFPRLDDVHPFYADLMNILYDRDHYKLALGQISTARHLIDSVSKEYCRLLKFGDSLYRCKTLKKAALGRMATIMKRQKDTLLYLEQVRQHLYRLPSIDPNTRTLLICGFPNVGKSSFINKVTRADVDVQPYAFTTKSLFVGHMDYHYLRWQVIDTPGILDHPLEMRNTIEMQSITALAHLRATVMFFLDISGTCGYSIPQQISLFRSIKPLFVGKPLVLVITKVDLKRMDQLEEDDRCLIEEVVAEENITITQSSTVTEEGVMETRNVACDKLLAQRVEKKMGGGSVGVGGGSRLQSSFNMLNPAIPRQRDQKERLPYIPEAVLLRRQKEKMASAEGFIPPPKRILARDVEREEGGAGVYNLNLKSSYLLGNDDWKLDTIPEMMNGHNIADFIDPEIQASLDRLEVEEEEMMSARYAEGAALEEELHSPEQQELRKLASSVRDRRELIKIDNRSTKRISKRTLNPARIVKRTSGSASSGSTADKLGEMMEIKQRRGKDRSTEGLKGSEMLEKAVRIKKAHQKARNQDARRGEGDHRIMMDRPQHLFSGKRGAGTNDRR